MIRLVSNKKSHCEVPVYEFDFMLYMQVKHDMLIITEQVGLEITL
jgi:hypothetical protein